MRVKKITKSRSNQLRSKMKAMLQGDFNMDADEPILNQSITALQEVRKTVYKAPFRPLRSREFIPVDNSVNNGTEQMKVYYQTEVGLAAIISGLADNIPLVELLQESRTMDFKSVAVGFLTSIQETRAAAKAGRSISAMKGIAAKNAINLKLDQIARYGDASAGLLGLFNNPYTTLYTIPTNGGGDQSWYTKSFEEILADLFAIGEAGYKATLESQEPDTMLMDMDLYRTICTKLHPNSAVSVKQMFLEASPYIKRIGVWDALKNAGAGGFSRIIAYRNSSDVLAQIIPQEFEMFPPQAVNLSVKTACHARTGGVAIYFPLGVVYADMDKAN
jgi:hypothetical protein